ncbi:HotDog domain-containing protein [Apiospora marii]|uniref:HotDog domain-containing protein n=1 Tax=Apiospora marii TaxID=335849 RepID=A0ABR1RUQ4_9PEZI
MDVKVAAELEYFRAVTWCAKHLDRVNLWVLPIVRTPPGSAAEGGPAASSDQFFLKTLNTPETVAHLLATAEMPNGGPASQQPVNEVNIFLAVGAGVMGFKGMAHGAFLAGIFDFAFIIKLGTEGAGAAVMKPPPVVTSSLNIRYRAPLRMDPEGGRLSHMRIVVKTKSRQETPAKRLVFEAVMDCEGVVVATAEAVYVQPRPRL